MNIISFRDSIDQIQVNEVGNKGYNLIKLSQNHFNVPNGIIIPTYCFHEFLRKNNLENEIQQKLLQIKESQLYVRRNLGFIRNKIEKAQFDENEIKDIEKKLLENGISLEKGVAVRSSSTNEDQKNISFAGVYSSFINITTIEELKKAIINVWSSSYTEASYLFNENFGEMAILIQQMVYMPIYGVAFTNMPDKQGYYFIETSSNITGVVDGNAKQHTILINRENPEMKIGTCAITNMSNFTKWLDQIETIQQTYCDIEFAVNDDDIYLLQCRPISVYEEIEDFAFFDQDSESECRKYYLGSCTKRYNRFLGKQKFFRDEVKRAGYDNYKQFYFICYKEYLNEIVQEKINQEFHKCSFVMLEFEKKKETIFCKSDEIVEQLRNYAQKHNLDKIYTRIGEVIVAEYSGYSSKINEDEIIIEYIPGRLNGLANGRNSGAKIIVKTGQINYIDFPYIDSIHTIEPSSGKIYSKDYDSNIPVLEKDIILQIADFTEKIMQRCKNARLEWYIANCSIYGKDISIEETSIGDLSNHINVISEGEVEGQIYYIPDVEKLDAISDKYEISLYAQVNQNYYLDSDSYVAKVIKEIRQLENPIIFASRPSVGILAIINEIKGAVFQQGAILSHIGICLREKGIPAVIEKKVFSDQILVNGNYVAIKDNGKITFTKELS